jgi:hypothetical protein
MDKYCGFIFSLFRQCDIFCLEDMCLIGIDVKVRVCLEIIFDMSFHLFANLFLSQLTRRSMWVITITLRPSSVVSTLKFLIYIFSSKTMSPILATVMKLSTFTIVQTRTLTSMPIKHISSRQKISHCLNSSKIQ